MSHKVLTTNDRGEWQKALESMPSEAQDFYFLPQYYALYEKEGVAAQCFVFTNNQRMVMYPYLKTSLEYLSWAQLTQRYYDIEGAYGYNGILTNSSDALFLKEFYVAFENFCRQEHIIAEFLRINPLLRNYMAIEHLQLKHVNNNIALDLSVSMEDIWLKSYAHCVRKNVHKAQESGVTIEIILGQDMGFQRMDEFIDIYYHTMDRRQTSKSYYFTKEYFLKIARDLGQNSLFVFALSEGKAISCELIVIGKGIGYSFLGGTLEECQQQRPNNLLKHAAIEALKNKGLHYYFLGGGRQPGDGIFRYKQTFAKDGEVNFHIGQKVHDQKVYDYLCSRWEKEFPQKKDDHAGFFLKYKC